MLKKAYLEITSECNLACSFCHGTSRKVKYMTEAEFTEAAKKLRPHTEYLYFHLMGEPLLHPLLKRFFEIAAELGFSTTSHFVARFKEAHGITPLQFRKRACAPKI